MLRYQIPEDWPYQEARRLFKEPVVSNEAEELKWTPPDEEVNSPLKLALQVICLFIFPKEILISFYCLGTRELSSERKWFQQ